MCRELSGVLIVVTLLKIDNIIPTSIDPELSRR